MPAFLVHLASMQNLTEMLKRDGITVITGNIIDNIWTDRVFNSHGYSVETGEGSLFRKIEQVVNEIIVMDISDTKQFSEKCRHICHLCTDISVGQTSSSLWGKWDNWFDFCSEFVWNKRQRGTHILVDGLSYAMIKHLHLSSIKIINEKNFNICKNPWYCFSKEFRLMTRECVYYGSRNAYMWIKFALAERNLCQ